MTPSEVLIEDAIRMAVLLRHPIYDCLYLACAARSGAHLVTADRRLLAAIESTQLASLARISMLSFDEHQSLFRIGHASPA